MRSWCKFIISIPFFLIGTAALFIEYFFRRVVDICGRVVMWGDY